MPKNNVKKGALAQLQEDFSKFCSVEFVELRNHVKSNSLIIKGLVAMMTLTLALVGIILVLISNQVLAD